MVSAKGTSIISSQRLSNAIARPIRPRNMLREMGLRVKRYGPLSTMEVVGRLVGTFESAVVIVTMAQASSATARTNTVAPSQPAGRSGGRNGTGTSQLN